MPEVASLKLYIFIGIPDLVKGWRQLDKEICLWHYLSYSSGDKRCWSHHGNSFNKGQGPNLRIVRNRQGIMALPSFEPESVSWIVILTSFIAHPRTPIPKYKMMLYNMTIFLYYVSGSRIIHCSSKGLIFSQDPWLQSLLPHRIACHLEEIQTKVFYIFRLLYIKEGSLIVILVIKITIELLCAFHLKLTSL